MPSCHVNGNVYFLLEIPESAMVYTVYKSNVTYSTFHAL